MGEINAAFSDGIRLFKEGNLPGAIAQFREALEAEQSNVQIHSYLGAAYAQSGQLDMAIQEFRAAMDLEPNNPANYANLGQAYEGVGNPAEAANAYEKALGVNPDYQRAKDRLAALAPKPAPLFPPPPGGPSAGPPPAATIGAQAPSSGPPTMPPSGPPTMPPPAPSSGPPTMAPAPTAPGQPPANPYGPPPSARPGGPVGGPMGTYPSVGGPRAVAAVYNNAGFWIRFGACLIDGILLFAVNWVIGIVMGSGPAAQTAALTPHSGGPNGADTAQIMSTIAAGMAGSGVAAFVDAAYFVGMNTACGATLGKMACGIRIQKTDGSKIGFGTALGRYVLQNIFATFTCGLAYIVVAVNAEHRGWHDQVMGTEVVHVK